MCILRIVRKSVRSKNVDEKQLREAVTILSGYQAITGNFAAVRFLGIVGMTRVENQAK